jgi:hypothetical protein
MSRPLLVTMILSVAVAAIGHASPAAFILPPADGLQSRTECHVADSSCGTAGLTSESPNATVIGDSGPAGGGLGVSRVEGALPTSPSEPMSYVLVGSGLLVIGSFARRRRRASE